MHFRFRLHVQMLYYSLTGQRVLEQMNSTLGLGVSGPVIRAVHLGSTGSEMVFLTTRGKNVLIQTVESQGPGVKRSVRVAKPSGLISGL